jgi:hypothetical protein
MTTATTPQGTTNAARKLRRRDYRSNWQRANYDKRKVQHSYCVPLAYQLWVRGRGSVSGLALTEPTPPCGLAADCGSHAEHSITSGTVLQRINIDE